MKNTDISRMLGELWRNTPLEEKRHHIEREAEERERYKISIAEWRKQQETMQLAGKAGSITSSPVSAIGSDIGRKVQPVILEDDVTARVYNGGDDTYSVYPHVSDDHITSKDNYGVSLYPPRMMRNGPHQYHRQKHVYPEYSSQEHYIHDCTQDVYPIAPRYYPQKQCRSLRSQQYGTNSVNDRDFNPIPFRNNYGHLESHARQQRKYKHDFSLPSNNDLEHLLQNNIEQEGHVTHHQYHCQKQQRQHALEQNIGRYVSFEHSDEINQQYVQDETKQVNSNMDNLYYQHQNYSAQDNMKQEYGNMDRQHLNQQPSQHDMDQDISHNMSIEKLDNTQQMCVSLGRGGGFVSPLNMYDDGEYDHAHIS